MLSRSFLLFVCLAILVVPLSSYGATPYVSSGSVNMSSGDPDPDLKYEDFQITTDGYLIGYIINDSNKTRPAVRLDMWTTNIQETRVFWRKPLQIGDMEPRAKFTVKERYQVGNEDPARIKVMFRIPSGANFRNK